MPRRWSSTAPAHQGPATARDETARSLPCPHAVTWWVTNDGVAAVRRLTQVQIGHSAADAAVAVALANTLFRVRQRRAGQPTAAAQLPDELSGASDVVTGPGGSQVVLDDPSGNPIELFQPANWTT